MSILRQLFGRHPSLDEDRRREIFSDYMETHDTQLLLGTNLAQEIATIARSPSGNMASMVQSLQQNTTKAHETTIAMITKKYNISESQLNVIITDGKRRKWPFRGVKR